MRYRPLLAISLMVCVGSAFLLEMQLLGWQLLLLACLALLTFCYAIYAGRVNIVRSCAAIVISCWVAGEVEPSWCTSIEVQRAMPGRVEGRVVGLRIGASGMVSIEIDGEVDLQSAPAMLCRSVVRIRDCPEHVRGLLQRGSRVVGFSLFESATPPVHQSQFNAQRWVKGAGISIVGQSRGTELFVVQRAPYFNRLISEIRSSIDSLIRLHVHHKHVAIVSALVVGMRDGIDTDVRTDFSRSGVSHILSVSGSHVGIIIVILLSITGSLSRSRTTSTISIVLLGSYALLTGAEPPTLRACLMAALAIIGTYRERDTDVLNILGGTTLLLLLISPAWLTSPSFILSTVATYGIIVVHPHWKRHVTSAFALSLSATGAVSIPGALLINSVPVLGPIANIVVVPLITIAMISAITLVAFCTWMPAVAKPLAWCIEACLDASLWSVSWFSNISPSLDHISMIIVAMVMTTLMLWPAFALLRRHMLFRVFVVGFWLVIAVTIPTSQTHIEVQSRRNGIAMAIEHANNIHIATISMRYGSIVVRSHHDRNSSSIRR